MDTTTSSIVIVNTEVLTPSSPIMPLILDFGYKGDALTKRAGEILGLSGVDGWEVVDSKDNLSLVHYSQDADMTKFGHLRGVLIDTEVGATIADSFGYTPTAVSSKLLVEEDGKLSIIDQDGANHTFRGDSVTIKPIFEGVVIRAIWHNSEFLRITHRKINPTRSRWGSSKSFIAMYEEAGGPTADQLFDTTKPYSTTTYDFLVSAKPLVVGTRQRITTPYIVLLAQREMDVKRPEEQVAKGKATFTTTNTIGGSVTQSVIHDPKPMTVAEANYHLRFGYYAEFEMKDERQLTGEGVIVYSMNPEGIVTDIVKVHSRAYDWRITMRGNNPNITHQFYCLLNSVYADLKNNTDWEMFANKLIVLPLYDEAGLRNMYEQTQGILMIPPGEVTRMDYTSRESRIYLLWMNFVLSLPPSSQAEGLNILTECKKDRANLLEWIQNIEATTKNIEGAVLPSRVKGLISCSRRLARERIDNGDNYAANGGFMRLPVIIKSTLRNLLNKENGPSLFSLIREMKTAKSIAAGVVEGLVNSAQPVEST